jgi:hypothetical protein
VTFTAVRALGEDRARAGIFRGCHPTETTSNSIARVLARTAHKRENLL